MERGGHPNTQPTDVAGAWRLLYSIRYGFSLPYALPNTFFSDGNVVTGPKQINNPSLCVLERRGRIRFLLLGKKDETVLGLQKRCISTRSCWPYFKIQTEVAECHLYRMGESHWVDRWWRHKHIEYVNNNPARKKNGYGKIEKPKGVFCVLAQNPAMNTNRKNLWPQLNYTLQREDATAKHFVHHNTN